MTWVNRLFTDHHVEENIFRQGVVGHGVPDHAPMSNTIATARYQNNYRYSVVGQEDTRR